MTELVVRRQCLAHPVRPHRAGAPHLAAMVGLPAPRLSPQPTGQQPVGPVAGAQPPPLHTSGWNRL